MCTRKDGDHSRPPSARPHLHDCLRPLDKLANAASNKQAFLRLRAAQASIGAGCCPEPPPSSHPTEVLNPVYLGGGRKGPCILTPIPAISNLRGVIGSSFVRRGRLPVPRNQIRIVGAVRCVQPGPRGGVEDRCNGVAVEIGRVELHGGWIHQRPFIRHDTISIPMLNNGTAHYFYALSFPATYLQRQRVPYYVDLIPPLCYALAGVHT